MRGALKRWFARGPANALGRRGERVAARHLKRQGYRVLARNARNRFGEIDLIVQRRGESGVVVFVEVKAGSSSGESNAYPPELHVDRRKQRRLAALSAQWLRARGWTDRRVRYDVVAVELPARGEPVVRHHVGAFEAHV